MAENPFLTIVIPTYNRAHLIADTLKSVLTQTDPDFEVIVIDDGSKDNTEEVVNAFLSEKVHYYRTENNERGAARNVGTSYSKGKYINWFDSDDLMFSNHVSTLKQLAEKNRFPEVLTVHYRIQYFGTKKITPVPFSYKGQIGRAKDFLLEGNYLSCNSVVVRRDVALKNKFIEDRALSASEDYELWLRLKAKYPFYGSQVVTSCLIQHPERSVNQMSDHQKMEKRFLSLIEMTLANEQTRNYIGKDLNYFKMRNYLVMAVDLAYHNHKKLAFHYLRKGFFLAPVSVTSRVFWATIKHLVL